MVLAATTDGNGYSHVTGTLTFAADKRNCNTGGATFHTAFISAASDSEVRSR